MEVVADAGRRELSFDGFRFPLPVEVDDASALALARHGVTAWHLLRTCAHLRRGESVVVHDAAGGVGALVVQLAVSFGAGRVVATAPTQAQRRLALRLGADVAVDSSAPGLTERLLAGGLVDVVVGLPVGGGGSVGDGAPAGGRVGVVPVAGGPVDAGSPAGGPVGDDVRAAGFVGGGEPVGGRAGVVPVAGGSVGDGVPAGGRVADGVRAAGFGGGGGPVAGGSVGDGAPTGGRVADGVRVAGLASGSGLAPGRVDAVAVAGEPVGTPVGGAPPVGDRAGRPVDPSLVVGALALLAPFGRLVCHGEPVDVDPVRLGSRAVVGFRLVDCLARPEMVVAALSELTGLTAAGRLHPLPSTRTVR